MKINLNFNNRKINKFILFFLLLILFFTLKNNVFALEIPEYASIYENFSLEYNVNATPQFFASRNLDLIEPFDYFGNFLKGDYAKYFLISEYKTNNDTISYVDIWAFKELPYWKCEDHACFSYNSTGEQIFAYYFHVSSTAENRSTTFNVSATSGITYREFPYDWFVINEASYWPTGQLPHIILFSYNFDFMNLYGTILHPQNDFRTRYFDNTGDYHFVAEEDNRNFFERVVDFFKSFPQQISTLFNNLFKGIGNFFNNLIDGIKSIFLPDSDMLLDTLETQYEYMENRLGFLFYPITLIRDFVTRFSNLSNSNNAVFNIPNVSLMGVSIISASSINLLEIVNSNTIFQYIYSIYRIVVSAFIVIWLSKLAYKKFNETLGGGYK